MATKLDEMIAKVALEAARADPDRMMAVATEIAPKITREDAAKLPERWSPKITSKAAGIPQFRDAWPRAWFEALVEILFQKGAIGLPGLLELLDRDGATYHENVVLRLLRLADSGVERDMILAKLKSRLPALHQTQVYACVREVVFWSERDPMVLELLRPMAKLKVKNAEGATVGTYIKQYEAELALAQAKRAPRTSADPLDELIVATTILALEPDAFRAQATAAAGKLGPSAAEQLLERLPKPDLTTLQSRAPAGLSNCAAAWSRAVIEILGHLGSAAVPAAWSILDSGDGYLQEKSLRLLCLLAARETGVRGTVIDQLRNRLPTFHHRELRPVVSDLLVDARRDERVLDVLGALGDVAVKDYGNGTIAVEKIVRSLFVPPKPIPAVNPSHQAAGKAFAERFGAAVVAKDFATAHGMFCAPLRKSITPKKLAALVATECKHSGPPDAFEYSDNDTTIAELREGKNEFSPLPDHVTDSNFRRWCCLQFVPVEEADADACFDWWMALIEEKGEWKVGSFHVLDAD